MAFFSFLTYSVSAAALTPYLLKHIGAAAYGLIPLAGLFTQYAAMITEEISKSVNRFLTIEIQKDGGRPNRVFNSSFALYTLLILFQIPVFIVGLSYADQLFSIPAELMTDALLLLGFSAGSFLLSLLGAVFNVSIFSKNRLDIGNALVIGQLILRLTLIVTCFSVWGPKLRYIGYVDFGLQFIMFLTSIYYCRQLTPELTIDFKQVDWKILGPVFKMSSWTLVNRLGSILFLRSDIWIINRFISPVAAGQYAAILVIANFIRQLASQVSGQLAPTIMTFWAKEDLHNLRRLLSFSVKVLSLGLAIPVGLICFNGGEVLGLWLDSSYVNLALLLFVMMVHMPINTGILPLFTLNTASNSVKLPAMITLAMGIVNVVLSYVLGVTYGYGAMGVAIATAIVLTLKNAFFIPIYGASVLNLPRMSFLGATFGSVVMLGVVYLLNLVPIRTWLHLEDAGFGGLAVQAAFVCACCAALAWYVIISKDEKRVLTGMLPARLLRSH